MPEAPPGGSGAHGFVQHKSHTNGIENFWGPARIRPAKLHCLNRATLYLQPAAGELSSITAVTTFASCPSIISKATRLTGLEPKKKFTTAATVVMLRESNEKRSH